MGPSSARNKRVFISQQKREKHQRRNFLKAFFSLINPSIFFDSSSRSLRRQRWHLNFNLQADALAANPRVVSSRPAVKLFLEQWSDASWRLLYCFSHFDAEPNEFFMLESLHRIELSSKPRVFSKFKFEIRWQDLKFMKVLKIHFTQFLHSELTGKTKWISWWFFLRFRAVVKTLAGLSSRLNKLPLR